MTTITGTKEKHWRIKFLDALRLHGIVTYAAMMAGIDRDTAYYERKKDPIFAQEWQEALDRGVDMLEDIAKKRAMETSDTLLIFLLKAHRPDKYREVIRNLNITIDADDLSKMSDDELDAYIARLSASPR